MSKNNKSTPEYIFKFPVGTEDPIDPVIGQAYFNESVSYLRIFGTNNNNNTNSWCIVPVVWDDNNSTDKE